MPPEGAVPDPGDRAFGLIETFRWSRDGGYDYLREHMARLERSAAALGFACRRDLVTQRLASFAAGISSPAARVRLVVSRGGSLEMTSTPLGGPPRAHYRVAVAGARHRADNPWLRHKTTMRDVYERPLAEAAAAVQADEVLFLNERDELCEGARTNLFVLRGEVLLTPSLTCGVLSGTLRAHLIELGKAREDVLGLADLLQGEWFMGNSVRGLIPGVLAGP